MGNVSKDMEILRKNQGKVLEIKTTVTKKKNAFNGLIKGLDMTQERVSELEYVTIETSKTEKEKRQEGNPPKKTKTPISKTFPLTVCRPDVWSQCLRAEIKVQAEAMFPLKGRILLASSWWSTWWLLVILDLWPHHSSLQGQHLQVSLCFPLVGVHVIAFRAHHIIQDTLLISRSLIQSLFWSPGWEDPLQKGKATHFSILAWRIPWTL